MWHPRRTREQAALDDVLTEASRLIEGRTMEAHTATQRVAGWVPLNCLAHSNANRLQQIADDHCHAHPGSWSATLAYLATDLLASVPNDTQLRRVQRDVLIPLELDVLAKIVPAPATPSQLATLVGNALTHHHMRRDL